MLVGAPRGASARALAAVAAAAVLSGCGSHMVLAPENLDQGLVIVLPGIDGGGVYCPAACHALSKGSIGMAVELYPWTAPLGPLYNQTAVLRNREAAGVLAGRIQRYQEEHPEGLVYLIGHSGGTAIAVWAAEALPDGREVQGIILLGSSLSPGYDLSRALARTREGIVSFHSDLDGGLLGLGTTLVGTMDGVHGESAGKVGFRPRAGPTSPGEYARLYQVGWQPKMARAGHGGGHFDYMGAGFLSAYVEPLLSGPVWDSQVVASAR
jgi:pimeloyl-ACP methyl ester carboxylesterase